MNFPQAGAVGRHRRAGFIKKLGKTKFNENDEKEFYL
jgi:hypothetical protein